MPSLIAALAAVAYLVAALLIARHLALPPATRPGRDSVACITVCSGGRSHAAAIWPTLALWSGPSPDLPATISIAGLATAAVFGIALLWRIDHVVGALVLPLAAITPIVPMVWPEQTIPLGTASSRIHAVISILTYAVLSLAALQALILAVSGIPDSHQAAGRSTAHPCCTRHPGALAVSTRGDRILPAEPEPRQRIHVHPGHVRPASRPQDAVVLYRLGDIRSPAVGALAPRMARTDRGAMVSRRVCGTGARVFWQPLDTGGSARPSLVLGLTGSRLRIPASASLDSRCGSPVIATRTTRGTPRLSDVPLGILIGALVVLVILSACFSGSETGMMALNRYRLRHLARSGHRGARRASRLLERPDRLIGLILLGTTS